MRAPMGVGLGEVEGRAGDRRELAGGDELGVDGGVAAGVEHEGVAEDVAGAGEIEVGVVGEVDDGGLVGGGGVVDAQLVARRGCSGRGR